MFKICPTLPLENGSWDTNHGGVAHGPLSVDRTVSANVQVNWNFYQTNPSGIRSHGGPNVALGANTLVINKNMTGQTFFNYRTNRTETVNHGNMSQASLSSVIAIL